MKTGSEDSILYDRYVFSKRELMQHLLIGIAYYFAMGMIFFNHIVLALVACLLTVFYLKERKKEAVRRRKENLRNQFREGMYALASALSAGRSVEQAFVQSLQDLKLIYAEEADIIKEWKDICYKLTMNETVESAMTDFAERSGVEDIDSFNSVFVMAKRSGGNLIGIIGETSRLISEKMDIQKEIDILIVQKQYEQKILSYIIPGMILFFGLVSPDFLEPLYTTLLGRLIMILALLMYLVAGHIGKKIVAIEV